MWAMRALVRDYTRVGDLVCDPLAGGATTLLAALTESRLALGSEVDADTHAAATGRLERGYTTDLFATRLVKQCASCRMWFSGGAFARDRTRGSQLQSWCRACKAAWECGVDGSWKRLRRELEKKEPASLDPRTGWTEAKYRAFWSEHDERCERCGAGLREWQSAGHNLDRINNSDPHVPGNCRLVCWPCNKRKSNKSSLVHDPETELWIQRYGRGRVPWSELMPGMTRAEVPSVDEFRIDPGLRQMALLLDDKAAE